MVSNIIMNNQSGIIFLGFCERASYVREGHTNIFKWNVIGLKHILVSNIFPMNLSGINIGIAINNDIINDGTVLKVLDIEENEIGTLEITLQKGNPTTENVALKKESQLLYVPEKGWLTAFLPIEKSDIVIKKPGIYYISISNGDKYEIIGEFQFALANPPPLTEARIAAIKSDPTSSKIVRMILGCKICSEMLYIYAALENNSKLEADGYKLYTTIPDEFTCTCGKTNFSLDIVRRNLHGVLGHSQQDNKIVSFTPLYEESSLENIRLSFVDLLNLNPKEEILQQFIQENPILLHQFPADEIFFKPPILTLFKADFGILTPKKELILIELEKTTTKLMKKDGGMHSELNHAFDQIREWQHVVAEHRIAVLESLKIDKSKKYRGQVYF